ncbi:MAG TPA: tetratricopeptide repeat protein [Vicinamibacterales bacterium]|nr:tetratricopeptide repeat protein [Vicinamibacterales bacterium]
MTNIFDLHDGAYYAWRDAGVRDATLVHVDAHHDATADPEWKTIDIGNFVRAAIRDRLVRAFCWVVPDPMWQDFDTRAVLVRERDDISESSVDIWMGPLDALPRIGGDVLLDIDVDYLVTASYADGRSAEPLARPWCSAETLADRIRALSLVPVVTTIAMSVTGGFTPLRWAHLAHELGARLDGLAPPKCDAAKHFAIATRLQAQGQLDAARAVYRRACELDPFYGHPFRTRGPYLLRRGRLNEAAQVYREALDLDHDDPHAQLGLAIIAARQERWAEARELAQRALAAIPESLDGWRIAGAAAAGLGDTPAAIRAFERALALGLHGAAPLGGPWSSNPDRRIVDPRHWDDHKMLSGLHEMMGSHDAAAAHRRMAAAGAAVLPS